MDIISFNEASTANSRIEKINANPDSTSGIVTQPSVIASGETITIPAGRTAILANTQVDGVLNIDGEVFVPSGSTVGDLEEQIASKIGLTGDQTIAGVKTFSSSPIVPTPTTDMQASNKKYVDDLVVLKAPLSSPAFTGNPTAPTPSSGDNDTSIATTAFVKTKSEGDSIGVNQTWQYMTSQRVAGATYTNTTGKPIMVAAECSYLGIGTRVFTINGIVFGTGEFNYSTNLFFIVPNNNTYSITGTMDTWLELR